MVISLSENGSPFFLSGECLGKYNLCICVFGGVCVYSRFFMIEKWFQALEKSCKDHFLGLIRGEGIFLQGLPV